MPFVEPTVESISVELFPELLTIPFAVEPGALRGQAAVGTRIMRALQGTRNWAWMRVGNGQLLESATQIIDRDWRVP